MDEAERAFRDGFDELVGRGPALGPVDPTEVMARGATLGTHQRLPWGRWLAAAAAIGIVAGIGVGAWTSLGRSGSMPAVPAATPHAASPVLVGPTWLATRIGERNVIADSQGAVPFLVFATDGALTGGDPCNPLRGAYRQDGGQLTITDVAAREMGCGERDVVLQQGRFADALNATRQARRSADTLEFVDADGAVVLTLVAEDSSPRPSLVPTTAPSGTETATPTPTLPPDSSVTNTVSVRIRNDSAVTFDRVEVGFYNGPTFDYGLVRSGASSQYRTPRDRAYQYAKVVVTVGGERLVYQPVDFVGETPLEPGRFTYALSVTDEGDLSLEFEIDR